MCSHRGAGATLDVWLNIADYLERADVYLDATDQALIYAFDLPGVTGKIVVRINYSSKVARKIINSNFIRTGGIVKPQDLLEVLPNGESRYLLLDK